MLIPTFQSKFANLNWEYALSYEIGASIIPNPEGYKNAIISLGLAELRAATKSFVETNKVDWAKVFTNLPQWIIPETLVATGNNILQYPHLGEDIGDFISFKLMAIRESFGGVGDPRMNNLKTWKEYTPSMFETPYKDLKPEQIPLVRRIQAGLLVPEFYVELEKREERIDKLCSFCEEHGIWLFPLPPEDEEVAIDLSNKDGTAAPIGIWLNLLKTWGIKMSGVKVTGAEAYPCAFGWSVDNIDTFIELEPMEGGIHDKFLVMNANNWWLEFLGVQLNKLTPYSIGELVQLLAPEACTDIDNTSNGLSISYGTAKVGFDFHQNKVYARQVRQAFGQFFAGDKLVPARVTLFWLALTAADRRTFGSINGIMNDLPNVWQREVNYGLAWEENHPTAVIRNNGGLPLRWEGVRGLAAFSIHPYNEKFDASLARKCLGLPEFRDSIYVDKNAMKVVAGNGAGKAGLTAVQRPKEVEVWLKTIADGGELISVLKEAFPEELTYFEVISRLYKGEDPRAILVEEFSWFVTANDGAKITKLLNRVQQGGSYNECDISIVFKDEVYVRAEGDLQIIATSTPVAPTIASTQEEDAFINGLMSK